MSLFSAELGRLFLRHTIECRHHGTFPVEHRSTCQAGNTVKSTVLLALAQPLINPVRALPRREERSQILNVGPGAPRLLLLSRWKLPLGSLIIVDDADHLQPEQLRWLTKTAAATNTKLVLITTADNRQPAHTLLAVLTDNMPSAQRIGTPDPHQQHTPTTIQRAEHHLATTSGASHTRNQATQLLQRRNQLIDRLRDIAATTAHIDTATERSREHSRDNDHRYGLGL